MKKFGMIEIDIDVYKRIEQERISFDEPHTAILRRMLGIKPENKIDQQGFPERPKENGNGMQLDDVYLPNGTELRKYHKGELHTARVEGGAIVLNGQRFRKPSPAGVAVTGYRVNGYRFWDAKLPGDNHWMRLEFLRGKHSLIK